MKKLLSILATVGLTATAGATVVACSNKSKDNEKVKNIADYFKDEKLNLGEVQSKIEALEKAQNIINSIPELKGKVVLGKAIDGKIKVTPKTCETDLTGFVEFKYSFVQTRDINSLLTDEDLDLGDVISDEEALQKAKDKIDSIPELKGKVDVGPATDGKVKVTPKPDETGLTGSIEFEYNLVKVRDIADLLTSDQLDLGEFINDDLALQKAISVIDSIPELKGKVVLGKAIDGKIHVRANDKFLKGEFDFIYKIAPIDISGLVTDDQLNLGDVISDAEALDKVRDIIDSIPELKGKVDIGSAVDGKVKVTPKPGETTLTGSIEFEYNLVKVHDISEFLTGEDLNLGKFLSDAEALQKAISVIDNIVELKGKVELGQPLDGKIHVQANDKFLKGELDFVYEVVVPVDINGLLTGEDLDLGDVISDAEALQKAKDKIDSIPELKGKVDVGPATDGKIKVTPKDGEIGLTGSVEFKYNLVQVHDISEFLTGEDLDLGKFLSDDEALQKAISVIDNIVELKGKVELGQPLDGKIHVQANDKFLKGELDFIYEVVVPVDINGLLTGEDLDLGDVISDAEALQKAKDKIDSIPELKGKVDIGPATDGKIKVTPKDGEIGLTGSVEFEYNVKRVRDISEFLKKGQLDLGKFLSDAEALQKAISVIDNIAELKGKVELGQPLDGKIHVQANDKFLKGELNFVYEVVVPVDISSLLNGEDLDLGDVLNTDEAFQNATKVINKIDKLRGNVKLSQPVDGKIKVTPKDGEISLTGSAEFKYNVKLVRDINDFLTGEDLDLGKFLNTDDALQKAKDKIDSIPELKGKVEIGQPRRDKIHVWANDKFLKGELDFAYEVVTPVDISSLLNDKQLDLGDVLNTDEALQKATKIINGLDKLRDKVDLGQPVDGKIKVTPKDGEISLTGSSEFKYNVKRVRNISEFLSEEKLDLGQFKNSDQAMTKAKDIIASIPELNDDKVKLVFGEGNSIYVKPNNRFLTGSAMFRYKLIKIEKVSIASIPSWNYDFGVRRSQIEKDIQEKIDKLVSGTDIGRDYEIYYQDDKDPREPHRGENFLDGLYFVKSNPNSDLIKGQFSFYIKEIW